MKKLIALSFTIILFQLVNAQDSGSRIFKKFKVDVSLGYAIPQESTGSGHKAGVIFVVEPKYVVMDQLSVGLRLEGSCDGQCRCQWRKR